MTERDGVEYVKCKTCMKEIIATKSSKCMKCFELESQEAYTDKDMDAARDTLRTYQVLGKAGKFSFGGKVGRI